MASHLAADELAALQASTLDRSTPFAIQGVSLGFFSVARHYGGATYNGASYTYFPESDELVRDDVVRWVRKRRAKVKTEQLMQKIMPIPDLFPNRGS